MATDKTSARQEQGWDLGDISEEKVRAKPKKKIYRKEIRSCDRAAFYETVCAVIEMHMHQQLHCDFKQEEIYLSIANDLQQLVDKLREV